MKQYFSRGWEPGCGEGVTANLIPAETAPLSLLLPWFLREIIVLYPQFFS